MQSRITESEPNSCPIIQGIVHTLSTSPSDKRGPCVPCLHEIPTSIHTRPVMAILHLRYGMDILGIDSVSDPFLHANDHFSVMLVLQWDTDPLFCVISIIVRGSVTWFGVVEVNFKEGEMQAAHVPRGIGYSNLVFLHVREIHLLQRIITLDWSLSLWRLGAFRRCRGLCVLFC